MQLFLLDMRIKNSFKSLVDKVNLKLKSSMILLGEWAKLCRFYLILLTIVMIAFPIIFSYSGTMYTDLESTRNILNILIQSEVAIFAIVVSLSLVAVELAATSYSSRVIDVFKNTPDFLILLETYLIAIVYELILLKLVNNNNLLNLNAYIFSAFSFGIFAFVALVPYIWNTLEMLKPTTITKKLAEKITKDSVLAFTKTMEKESEKDTILPIIDIVRKSMMEYDDETMRDALRAIEDRNSQIFKETETFKDMEEYEVSNHFYSSLSKIGELAIELKHSYEAYWIVRSLGNLGKETIKLRRPVATGRAFYYLGVLGKEAVENGFFLIYDEASNSLSLHGKEAAEAGKEFENPTEQALTSLKDIGTANDPKQFNVKSGVVNKLQSIEKVADEKNIEMVKLMIEGIKKTLEY